MNLFYLITDDFLGVESSIFDCTFDFKVQVKRITNTLNKVTKLSFSVFLFVQSRNYN